MKDSKLVEILKTLSPEEFRDLEKFAASPFLSIGRDLTPFLKILKPFHPTFESEKLTNEFIIGKLYPGNSKGNVQQTMKTLSSDLIRMCKEYFKQIEFKRDLNRGSYYLANQLRVRKLYKDFEKEYRSAIEYQKNNDAGGVKDFIEKYFFCIVARDFALDKDDFVNSFEQSLSASETILTAGLMSAFLIEDEKNIANGYNLEVRYNLMSNLLESMEPEKLIENMKLNEDRNYPYLLVYYMIYKMHKSKDRKYYFELKNILKDYKHLFGQAENYVFWNILMSFCSANRLEHQELFSIYNYILENNIYRKSNFEDFHIILYRNIVTTTSLLDETVWLEKFIEKYLDELHVDHRENMRNLSYAFLNFERKNFEKALEYISRINLDIFIFKLDVKNILFKTYYELSYYEQALSLLDSSFHYIKSTKDFSESSKKLYFSFLKTYKEMLKFKMSENKNKTELAMFKENSKKESSFMQSDWLLRKIEELK